MNTYFFYSIILLLSIFFMILFPWIGIPVFFIWVFLMSFVADDENYNLYDLDYDYDYTYNNSIFNNIRREYESKLKKYYKNHSPRMHLINDYCEARLVKEDAKSPYFYVKQKRTLYSPGMYFEVSGNMIHVNTMWAIFDMEFNNATTYNDLESLYFKLNYTAIEYFHKKANNLPPIITDKNKNIIKVQNEYCYMERLTQKNNESGILCSEIWGEPVVGITRKFIIRANKSILDKIFLDFSIEHKNDEFDVIFEFYSNRYDCTVELLNSNSNIKTKKSPKKNPQELLDINNALESELAKLPGINIILAKRIIKQRERIEGFKTKKEFYEFCKLKPHFVEQLDELIKTGKFEIQKNLLLADERTIDTIDNYDLSKDSNINDYDLIIVDTIDNYNDIESNIDVDDNNNSNNNGRIIDL